MDVSDLERFDEWLEAYLSQFADCFGRSDTRSHLTTYVRGQLSDLDAKSVEPIALQAGTPVRTLQEFLVQHRWNEDATAAKDDAHRSRRAHHRQLGWRH